MIFSRITGALKRRDWSGVAIEFVLVVAGILVALQLDAWAQQREDKRAYAAALDRMRGEIAANLEIIELVEDEIASELPLVRAAFDALETCSDDPQTLRTVNEGLAFIMGTSGLTQRTIALRELVFTPKLLALQSPAIRSRLAELHFFSEVVEREARFNEYFPLENRTERIPVLSPGPWAEVRRSYYGIDFTGQRRLPQLNVPVSVACKNTDLVAALWAWVRFQSAIPILMVKMREEYRLTIELLDDPEAI